jgi:hypothetical protein
MLIVILGMGILAFLSVMIFSSFKYDGMDKGVINTEVTFALKTFFLIISMLCMVSIAWVIYKYNTPSTLTIFDSSDLSTTQYVLNSTFIIDTQGFTRTFYLSWLYITVFIIMAVCLLIFWNILSQATKIYSERTGSNYGG